MGNDEPVQGYSLHPRQHKGSEKGVLYLTSSSSHHFSFDGSAPLSDVDSDLLFNSDSVDKAMGQAQQVALVSFTEAVAKALIKQKYE